MSFPKHVKLPFAPLYAASGAENYCDLARRLGVQPKTVMRWKNAGIIISNADDVAVRLGLHPCEVWGDGWWVACETAAARDEATRRAGYEAFEARKRQRKAWAA